jgi:hypothetical protein
MDRHRVRYPAGPLDAGITTGATVLVEGALVRDPDRRRQFVLARRVSLLSPAPEERPRGEGERTHRSPTAHDRAGHYRCVAIGTPRERLVWVREARVGEPDA